MSEVAYDSEPGLSVDEYLAVVGDSTLGASRPLADRTRVAEMLQHADLIVTARIDGQCVGLARCLTDFAWICYCGDLAVRQSFQRRGIGTGLLRACKKMLGDGVAITLLSAPEAVSYYERIGPALDLQRTPDAFFMPRRRDH